MFLVWFLETNPIFTQQIDYEKLEIIIAEPRSDCNRCYEQRMSENHNWILFIAVSLWFWSVAKYSRVLTLFTIELP